jgi:lipopolysaccharide transport system permease protein
MASLAAQASAPVLSPDNSVEREETVLQGNPGWHLAELMELWRYRELLYFLTWRDVKVRYKQTVLGAAWAILQPLATMMVFSVFFGRLAKMPSAGLPYSLFVLAGLLPWTFFANAVTSASQSIIGSHTLVTKVYFPRLIIPMGAVGAGLVDFAVTLAVFAACCLYYGVLPGMSVLLLPVAILGLIIAALGVGTLLAALTVAYRDFRYVVPFAMQLWMFATPSVYMEADARMGSVWNGMLPFNPVYGLIQLFRAAALQTPLDMAGITISFGVSVGWLIVGVLYFRRVERIFADVI